MHRWSALSLIALAPALCAAPAAAWNGDPSVTCRDALNESDGIAPVVDWVAGYVAGRTGRAEPVNRMAVDTAIALLCARDRNTPVSAIAEELARQAQAPEPQAAEPQASQPQAQSPDH